MKQLNYNDYQAIIELMVEEKLKARTVNTNINFATLFCDIVENLFGDRLRKENLLPVIKGIDPKIESSNLSYYVNHLFDNNALSKIPVIHKAIGSDYYYKVKSNNGIIKTCTDQKNFIKSIMKGWIPYKEN